MTATNNTIPDDVWVSLRRRAWLYAKTNRTVNPKFVGAHQVSKARTN